MLSFMNRGVEEEISWKNIERIGEGERLATLRNARNMKKAGVDLSLIAECTGLSLEIIQSL